MPFFNGGGGRQRAAPVRLTVVAAHAMGMWAPHGSGRIDDWGY